MISIFQQPLLQFLALGLGLFAVDYWMLEREDDPRRIIIDDERYAEIAGIFRDNQNRDPTEAEMAQLTIVWAQNEVLYREARLMGLDKGDEMIRSRLILKLRNVFFNRVETPKADDDELFAWFEKNRDRYDRPESFDWEQVYVGTEEAPARSLIATLGAADLPAEQRGDLRRYRQRPQVNFATVFGESDALALINTPLNQWTAVTSTRGWHAARITGRYEAEPALFAQIKERARREWEKETMDTELRDAMAAMASGYEIRMQLSEDVKSLTTEGSRDARLALNANAQQFIRSAAEMAPGS